MQRKATKWQPLARVPARSQKRALFSPPPHAALTWSLLTFAPFFLPGLSLPVQDKHDALEKPHARRGKPAERASPRGAPAARANTPLFRAADGPPRPFSIAMQRPGSTARLTHPVRGEKCRKDLRLRLVWRRPHAHWMQCAARNGVVAAAAAFGAVYAGFRCGSGLGIDMRCPIPQHALQVLL